MRRALGVPLQRAARRRRRVRRADRRALYNGADAGAAALADDLAQDLDLSRLLQEIPKVEDLLESQNDAPIIRLINALFTQALREGASDIHIEPFETRSVVRLRIDGTLRDLIEPARALHGAIVSRIKIMAQLDIAEKRLPQDGRIALRVAGKPIDVRVSTIPTGHGERVVLRLLDKQAGRLDLAQLGMDDATLAHMDELIQRAARHRPRHRPDRLGQDHHALRGALAPGSEGAQHHDGRGPDRVRPRRHQPDARSTPRIDMTFARALRTILRQDPDVVMIGEIRDLETAQIAVQASLTGHLVFATLHTNDAVSAVTRLVDMGVEPFLLASSLIGVVAQRLVRRLCLECRKPLRRMGAAAGARVRANGRSFYTARGLRRLQPLRLPRPHRHLRAAHRRRRAAPPDPRPRLRAGAARRTPSRTACARCATTACAGPRRA